MNHGSAACRPALLSATFFFFFLVLVLISVKTGLYLWPWANVVIDLRVEAALHDILLIVPIVCACPAAWGIGNLHQTAAGFFLHKPRPFLICLLLLQSVQCPRKLCFFLTRDLAICSSPRLLHEPFTTHTHLNFI